jgi:peptide/nickel transport system permease protein
VQVVCSGPGLGLDGWAPGTGGHHHPGDHRGELGVHGAPGPGRGAQPAHRDYVAVSRQLGARHRHTVFRHLVPNVIGTVVVTATLSMADAILIYAAVAFLGLSVPPPATSWGDLLTTGINNLFDGYWWQLWPPAFAIVLIVLAVNVLGDGMHDMVEHRLERR